MKKSFVFFYKKDTSVIVRRISPKNLGWILRNAKYINLVEIKKDVEGAAVYVEGLREDKHFNGFFYFLDKTVAREWVSRRALKHAKIRDLLA